jgi:hypothetical protein
MRRSALAEDLVVNSLYVEGPPINGSAAAELALAMRAFYNGQAAGQASSVRSYLGPSIAQNGHVTKVYRMEDPKPRVPIHTEAWNFSVAPGGSPIPTEVAVCLSFKAAPAAGQIAARRRGRIYIGPLNNSVVSDAGEGIARPMVAFLTDLRAAAQAFKATVNASGYVWVVHSPTTGPAARFPVTELWTDNAFDTQRRRGEKATLKNPAAVPQISLAA